MPTDKLSMRSFSNFETNIREEIANLKSIDKKIVCWLSSKGGEQDDLDFVEYRKKSSISLSAIEKTQSNFTKSRPISNLELCRSLFHNDMYRKAL